MGAARESGEGRQEEAGDPSGGSLGALLRQARGATASQRELAERLDVSQRHVSYVESGRARPSRALLLAWLRALRAPADLRNAALLLGGYAHDRAASAVPEDSEQFQLARTLLAAHEYPAICVDADWRLRAANPARVRMHRLVAPDLPPEVRDADHGVDMIDILVRPGGLLDAMRDAQRVGWSVLQQLRAESWANPGLQARVDDYERRLNERFARPAVQLLRPAGLTQLRMELQSSVGPLAFQAVQLMTGLPQNITPTSLRVALWYPLDERTREAVRESARGPVRR